MSTQKFRRAKWDVHDFHFPKCVRMFSVEIVFFPFNKHLPHIKSLKLSLPENGLNSSPFNEHLGIQSMMVIVVMSAIIDCF